MSLQFVIDDHENGLGMADNMYASTSRDYKDWILKQPDGNHYSIPSMELVEGVKNTLKCLIAATRAIKPSPSRHTLLSGGPSVVSGCSSRRSRRASGAGVQVISPPSAMGQTVPGAASAARRRAIWRRTVAAGRSRRTRSLRRMEKRTDVRKHQPSRPS